MAKLQAQNAELREALKLLRQENSQLKFQLAELRRIVFGSKSERHESCEKANQLSLFGEKAKETEKSTEQEKQIISYERKKAKKKNKPRGPRNSFPDHIRREEIVIEPMAEQIQGKVKIGEDITETLAYTPADLFIKRTIRPKYAEPGGQGEEVIQSPAPKRVIENGLIDNSYLAYIIAEKYQMHLPLYRQRKRLTEQDIGFIKAKQMSLWVQKGAQFLLLIYQLLKTEVLTSGYIQVDETTMRVLDSTQIITPNITRKLLSLL